MTAGIRYDCVEKKYMSSTQEKGDIAVAMAIADLTKRGLVVFKPVVNESLPFDLVVYKDGKFIRLQCKYCADRQVKNRTSWLNSKGNQGKHYSTGDFEYYAVYLPDVDKMVYPAIKYGGITITTQLPTKEFYGTFECWWYKDFEDFTDDAIKHDVKTLMESSLSGLERQLGKLVG